MDPHAELLDCIQLAQRQIKVVNEKGFAVFFAVVDKIGDVHTYRHIIDRRCHTDKFPEQFRPVPCVHVQFYTFIYARTSNQFIYYSEFIKDSQTAYYVSSIMTKFGFSP